MIGQRSFRGSVASEMAIIQHLDETNGFRLRAGGKRAPGPSPTIEMLAPLPPGSHNGQCLKCGRHVAGKHYVFHVGLKQSIAYQVVHQERAFFCHRCITACMGMNPWFVLAKLVVLTALGVLLCLAALRHYHFVRAFLVSCGFVPVLVNLVARLATIWGQGYHGDPSVAQSMTGLAMQLRKRDILDHLGLQEDAVRFLTDAEHQADVPMKILKGWFVTGWAGPRHRTPCRAVAGSRHCADTQGERRAAA